MFYLYLSCMSQTVPKDDSYNTWPEMYDQTISEGISFGTYCRETTVIEKSLTCVLAVIAVAIACKIVEELILAVCRTRVTYEPKRCSSSPRVPRRTPIDRYLGGHGIDSRRGLRIFLCPMLVTNEHVIFIIHSPNSWKF